MNEPVERWYSGKEIVGKYGIKDVQLFGLMRNGVQVRTYTDKEVVDEDSLPRERRHSLEFFEEDEQRYIELNKGKDEAGIVITGRGLGGHTRPERSKRSANEIKQIAQRRYDGQPLEILNPPDPNKYELISYTLTYDDIGRITAILKALSFLFLAADVDKFFDNDEVPPKEQSPRPDQENTGEIQTAEATATKENDKHRAKDIANSYINRCKAQNETPVIKDAIQLVQGEIRGKFKDRTIRTWINVLFPPKSRKPGAPRKK